MCILPFCDEIKNFRTSNSYSSKKDLHFSSVIYFVKKKSHICNEYFQITMNLNCSKRFSISSINTQVKYWERVKKNLYPSKNNTKYLCIFFCFKTFDIILRKNASAKNDSFFFKVLSKYSTIIRLNILLLYRMTLPTLFIRIHVLLCT